MTSLINLALASSVTFVAMPSALLAQDNERYFDGPYISGTVGLENPDVSRSDGFVFDNDADGQFDDTVRTDTGLSSFEPGFCSGAATSTTKTCRGNARDEGYAVRLGYDRHLGNGPLVVGTLVEGARPGVEEVTSGYTIAPESYTISRRIEWAVTGRARIGIAPGDGRGLFYATGGAGFARIQSGFSTSNAINVFTQSDMNDWQFGWQAGGGAEIMLTRNLGLGLEYLHSSYASGDHALSATQGIAADNNPFVLTSSGTDFRLSADRFDLHAFRASANFRF